MLTTKFLTVVSDAMSRHRVRVVGLSMVSLQLNDMIATLDIAERSWDKLRLRSKREDGSTLVRIVDHLLPSCYRMSCTSSTNYGLGGYPGHIWQPTSRNPSGNNSFIPTWQLLAYTVRMSKILGRLAPLVVGCQAPHVSKLNHSGIRTVRRTWLLGVSYRLYAGFLYCM
jgi:hypothetical protein